MLTTFKSGKSVSKLLFFSFKEVNEVNMNSATKYLFDTFLVWKSNVLNKTHGSQSLICIAFFCLRVHQNAAVPCGSGSATLVHRTKINNKRKERLRGRERKVVKMLHEKRSKECSWCRFYSFVSLHCRSSNEWRR
jgi:hypothetical protein